MTNNSIEKLKLENEKMLLELKMEKQKKQKKKKIMLISLIAFLTIIIVIGIIIYNIKLHDNSMLLNKLWNGVSESFQMYDSEGNTITIPSNDTFYIEFYDNNKYISYTMQVDWSNRTTQFLTATLGTYKVSKNIIVLKAEKFTRDGSHWQKVDYETKMNYNKSDKTLYYYQTTNKYLSNIDDYDTLTESFNNKNDKEKIEYKITYSSVSDEYYYNYYK